MKAESDGSNQSRYFCFQTFTMKALNQRSREVWLNAKHTKEDEIFALEKKKVGTK